MHTFTWFLVLTVFIISTYGRNRSVVKQESSLCIENVYKMPLFTSRSIRIIFNRTRLKQLNIKTIYLHATINDPKVAEFRKNVYSVHKIFNVNTDIEQSDEQSLMFYDLQVYAKFMNRTNIDYSIEAVNNRKKIHSFNCSVILMISQPSRLVDKIYKYSIPIVLMIVSIQIGVLLDKEVLKELIRRPIQVLIGFCCQYILMPTIALTITKLMRYEPIYGLALFAVGCSPGGLASNQWTVLLDGDLNLSAIMTFSSTFTSFLMMPLWLYTVGQYAYLRELQITIPYLALLKTLLTVMIPFGLGMLLNIFIPKLKRIVKYIVKPTSTALVCYLMIFSAIANFYLLKYVTLKLVLSATCLPWFGFMLGCLCAWICRQDWKRTITIGLETGVQNYSIAIMVLLYSLPEPYSTQSMIIPPIVAIFSSQPLYYMLVYKLIRKKCFKKKLPIYSSKSVDTLSKTTWNLTEDEDEPFEEIPQIIKVDTSTIVAISTKDPKITQCI